MPVKIGSNHAKKREKVRAKRPAVTAKKSAKASPARRGLGALPEWNLADLYAGLDDPAIKRDLDRADADCVAFEESLQGQARRYGGERRRGARLKR